MARSFALVAAAGAAAAAAVLLPAPDYLGYVGLALPAIDAAWKDRTCSSAKPGSGVPCNAAASLASAHAAWYEITKNTTSLQRLSHLLLLFVGSWRNATNGGILPSKDGSDFFSCRPLASSAATLLASSGGGVPPGWTAADVADMRTAAAQVCVACCQQGVFNQPASRASGLAVFASAFPELDTNGSLRAYAQATWEYWTTAHGYGENANVYNSIFLMETLKLGEALSPAALAAELQQPGTRSVLAHFRDLIGPTGTAPSYGDSWGGAGGSGFGQDAAPWGVEELFYWPTTFETAAAAYDDPGFAWAAASFFHAATGGYQLSPPLVAAPVMPGADVAGKSLVTLLEAHTRRAARPVAPAYFGDLGPAATTRRLPGEAAEVPDKLLVYASRAPCAGVGTPAAAAPYVAVELMSEGIYHGHVMQTGAITNYQAGGITFLHGCGRDNHVPAAAATVVLWPNPAGAPATNASRFPWAQLEDQLVPGGPWRLLELPTQNFGPPDATPGAYWLRQMPNLYLYAHNAGNASADLQLQVGHISLVNADTGAELVLNDFDPADPGSDAKLWSNGFVRASVAPDATLPRGKYALTLAVTPGGGSHTQRPVGVGVPLPAGPFDWRSSWQYLRLYWRVGAGSIVNGTDILRVGTGPYPNPPNTYPNASLFSSYDFAPAGPGPGSGRYPWAPGMPYNTLLLTPGFHTRVAGAWAAASANVSGDGLGVATLVGHFSAGVAWTRAVVTLAEGPLLVVDALTLAAGDHAAVEGWTGGVSFPLQVATDPTPVPGAPAAMDAAGFNRSGCLLQNASRDADARLLLWFGAWGNASVAAAGAARAVPLRVGAARMALVGRVAPAAVFAVPSVGGGVTAPPLGAGSTVFVSALLPHDASVAAAALAARIAASVSFAGGGGGGNTAASWSSATVTVTVPASGVGGDVPAQTATLVLTVPLAGGGGAVNGTQWSVSRQPPIAV